MNVEFRYVFAQVVHEWFRTAVTNLVLRLGCVVTVMTPPDLIRFAT